MPLEEKPTVVVITSNKEWPLHHFFSPFNTYRSYVEPIAKSESVNTIFIRNKDVEIKNGKMLIKNWKSRNTKGKGPKAFIPDYIFSTSENAPKKTEIIQRFAEQHDIPRNVSVEVARLCMDKYATYTTLKKHKDEKMAPLITWPLEVDNIKSILKKCKEKGIRFLVTKPRKGSAGKKVKIHDIEKNPENRLTKLARSEKKYVIQEVPKNIYTFIDRWKGERIIGIRMFASPEMNNGRVSYVDVQKPYVQYGMPIKNNKLTWWNFKTTMPVTHILSGLIRLARNKPIDYYIDEPSEAWSAEIDMEKQCKEAMRAIMKQAAKKEKPHSLMMSIEGVFEKDKDDELKFRILEINGRPGLMGKKFAFHLDEYNTWAEGPIKRKIEREAREHFRKNPHRLRLKPKERLR